MRVDASLVSSVINITYLTGFSNFSSEEREAYLIITPKKRYIITDPRYSEAIKKQVKDFELLERNFQIPLKKHLEDLIKKHKITTLGIEEYDLNVEEAKFFKKYFKKLVPINSNESRVIKTDEEIKNIKKACQIGDRAFKFILNKLKPGVSEKEVAFELEMFFKRQGVDKSFETIVAFDENSAVPHHQTGQTKLNSSSGQLILLDFGTKYQNYCSDMTRTVFLGEPSEKQIKIYRTVLEAQKKAINYIELCLQKRAKIIGSKVHQVASDYLESQGFPILAHGLGHGIGLEVHEYPRLSAKKTDNLKEGMVFSIEPGIYLTGYGGVRIEDLFAIKQNRLIRLTQSSNKLIIL